MSSREEGAQLTTIVDRGGEEVIVYVWSMHLFMEHHERCLKWEPAIFVGKFANKSDRFPFQTPLIMFHDLWNILRRS